MAMIICNTLYSSFSSLSISHSSPTKVTKPSKKLKIRSMQDHNKFMEFPYVSPARKEIMVDIISTVESRLQSQLLPCKLPLDVQNFKNPNGSSEASLYIRSGHELSPIDFILGTWIHCKIPTGASLNITHISGYLNSSTKAPNFGLELIQSSPTSLVLILDLFHRKDLVLHPDYLKTYYEDTALDSHRDSLFKLPEVKPYVSPSLFVRSGFSPVGLVVRIDAEEEEKLEEILRDHVGPSAKEILGVWLERCVEKSVMGDEEKFELERRDKSFRKKSIEVGLESQFLRMFGEEVSSHVLQVIKEAFGVI